MKKITGFSILALLVIVMTGCPYMSQFPIDQPGIKVESSWFGKYTGNFPEDYLVFDQSLTVSKKSTYEYKVVMESSSEKGFEDMEKNRALNKENESEIKPTEYTAHVSEINNKTFLNVLDASGQYYIFRIDKDGKTLVLKELSPVLKHKASDSDQLKDVIKRNMDNELLYGAEITLTKK